MSTGLTASCSYLRDERLLLSDFPDELLLLLLLLFEGVPLLLLLLLLLWVLAAGALLRPLLPAADGVVAGLLVWFAASLPLTLRPSPFCTDVWVAADLRVWPLCPAAVPTLRVRD